MQLKVGNSWSSALPVSGGVSHGSLIGVYLFNVLTDDLESGPGVHDVDPLMPGGEHEEGGDREPSADELEQDHGIPRGVSTPSAASGTVPDSFGTPSLKDIQLLRALRGEGGTFSFVGHSRTLNRQ